MDLRISKDSAIEKLSKHIEEGENLLKEKYMNFANIKEKLGSWGMRGEVIVKKIFINEKYSNEFSNQRGLGRVLRVGIDDALRNLKALHDNRLNYLKKI